MNTKTTKTNQETRADRIARLLNEKLGDTGEFAWAETYGEPGYSDPEKGILLTNWNNVAEPLVDCLEEGGYAIEWLDEWYIDCEGKEGATAWRTSPDCHSWVCQVRYCDGYVLTPDNDLEEWIEECESTDYNQPHSALPDWVDTDDLEERGWQKFNGDFVTGFHPGQNDNPTKIYQRIEKAHPEVEGVLFRIQGTGQFGCDWEAWFKLEDIQGAGQFDSDSWETWFKLEEDGSSWFKPEEDDS